MKFGGILYTKIKLAGDASNRIYFRLLDKENPTGKLLVEDPLLDQTPFLALSDELLKQNFLVPKIYESNIANKTAIIEDLGQTHLLNFILENPNQEFHYYKSMIDLISRFQKIQFGTLSFTWEKYFQEISLTLEWYFQKFLTNPMNSNEIESITKIFHSLMHQNALMPIVFTHRDLHCKNVMVKNNDQMYLIDFQDARYGALCYDLVSFIDDFYYTLSPSNYNQLFDYARSCWPQQYNLNDADFDICYYTCLLQRSFKVLGTFSLQYLSKNNPHYLIFIAKALDKIKLASQKLNVPTLWKIIVSKVYGP